MTRSALRRLVEAFFHRWYLYLLFPVLTLFAAVQVLQQAGESYTSTGTMLVDGQSLVSTQSGVNNGPSFGFRPPALATAQDIGGLLSTDVFMASVATATGTELSEDVTARATELRQLRRLIGVGQASRSIVSISATTEDPWYSADLVQAILDEYIELQIELNLDESAESEDFFIEVVGQYRGELDEAQRELDAALRGVADIESVPADRQLRIERLQGVEQEAELRYDQAIGSLEASQLAALQTETVVRQSYSILGAPEVSTAPDGRFLDDLIVLMMYGIAGVGLALVAPIASVMLNDTIVFPDDLPARLETPVVAVVPRQETSRWQTVTSVVARLTGAVDDDDPSGTAPAVGTDGTDDGDGTDGTDHTDGTDGTDGTDHTDDSDGTTDDLAASGVGATDAPLSLAGDNAPRGATDR
ncbi:MAG: hypothetical protein AAGA93_05070 [Actinomycetota bacterium]